MHCAGDVFVNMDIELIRTFVYAAETLSFSEAANKMYISQSTVSKYIATLEATLGEKLFCRHTHGVWLTMFGTEFLPHAVRLLDQEMEMQRFISDYSKGSVKPSIHLGIELSLTKRSSMEVFSHILCATNMFMEKHPHLDIKIKRVENENIEKMIDQGMLDLALASRRINSCSPGLNSVESMVLQQSKHYIALPPRTDMSKPVPEILSGIKSLTVLAETPAQDATQFLLKKYDLDIPLLLCKDFGEQYLRVFSEQSAAFLEISTRSIAERCGLKTILIPEFKGGSKLTLLYKKNKNTDLIQDYITILTNALYSYKS